MNIVGEEDEQQCNNMNRKIQKNQNHKSTTPPCHLCGAETTMVPPPLHLAVVGRLQIWVATKLPLFVPPQLPLGSTKLDHCGRRRREPKGREGSQERYRGRRRDEEAGETLKEDVIEEDATKEDDYENFGKWKRNMGSRETKKILKNEKKTL